MTTRFEGAAAGDVSFTILRAGEEIGVDVVPEGQIALCFNYDEVFYIQGTPEELVHLLAQGQRTIGWEEADEEEEEDG
jgi:hypothetical protein